MIDLGRERPPSRLHRLRRLRPLPPLLLQSRPSRLPALPGSVQQRGRKSGCWRAMVLRYVRYVVECWVFALAVFEESWREAWRGKAPAPGLPWCVLW